MKKNAQRMHPVLREEAVYKLVEITALAEVFLLSVQVLII